MYIRQIKKKRSDKAQTFYQYSLVQNTRIGQRVKQENILYLGSEAILADKQHRKLVAQAMKAMIYGEQALFPADLSSDLAKPYYGTAQYRADSGDRIQLARDGHNPGWQSTAPYQRNIHEPNNAGYQWSSRRYVPDRDQHDGTKDLPQAAQAVAIARIHIKPLGHPPEGFFVFRIIELTMFPASLDLRLGKIALGNYGTRSQISQQMGDCSTPCSDTANSPSGRRSSE